MVILNKAYYYHYDNYRLQIFNISFYKKEIDVLRAFFRNTKWVMNLLF